MSVLTYWSGRLRCEHSFCAPFALSLLLRGSARTRVTKNGAIPRATICLFYAGSLCAILLFKLAHCVVGFTLFLDGMSKKFNPV